LREVQQTTLHGADVPVQWRDTLEDVSQGPLIVIANEYVDALPVRQLVWRQHEWRERCVRIGASGGFEFCEGPAVPNEALQQLANALVVPDGSILEIRPAANALVSSFAARAQNAPLAALIVDYGHEETACGDTLQAISQHKFADPLRTPGEIDLTAHVDFAALKDAAAAHGLAAYGPRPQGAFLLQLGLEARRDRLCEGATDEQRQALVADTNRLVDPSAMGLLFKTLAITSQGLAPPPPFGDI
jgi:SAM-dependent MidA family methyltransferase